MVVAQKVKESVITEQDSLLLARLPNGLPEGLPAEFPPHKDWRVDNGGVLNPVKDQKNCGMCWAIVASEVTAAGLYIKGRTDKLLQLSASELLDCCESNKTTCYNYSTGKALAWIRENGIREETDYPFATTKCDCRPKTQDEAARAYRIRDIENVDKNDEIKLLEAVRMQPIAGGILVTDDLIKLKGEIYEGSDNFVLQPNGKPERHAILIVGYGYDEEEEKPYWLIKNSWGTEWGISGYGRILRSSPLLFGTKYPVF